MKLSSKTYQAAPYKVTVNVKPSKASLSSVKSKQKKQATASWKKLPDKQKISGYQISYSTKKNFKPAKQKDLKKTLKSVTLKSLKPKTTYYIRIRAYKKVGKNRLYGAWSKAKSVKVK